MTFVYKEHEVKIETVMTTAKKRVFGLLQKNCYLV